MMFSFFTWLIHGIIKKNLNFIKFITIIFKKKFKKIVKTTNI